MGTQLQHKRGTTAQHTTFTGANGEITVDTTKKTAVVHDGLTAGGTPLAKESDVNLKINITDIIDNLTSTLSSKPLSANQGKVLKDYIDAINTLLTSNDTSLDTIQEIVSYIKLNKASLDSLADIHSKTAKITPVDADEIMIADSATTFSLKKITWASIKTTIKTYLDGFFIPKISTPTTNSLAKVQADGTVTNSTSIYEVNTNVGIGTSVINNKLEVNGSIGFGSITGNGRIFSDVNWGCLLQSDVSSPAVAEFGFLNNAGAQLAIIDTRGNLLLKSGTGGLGYGTGSGETAIQPTNKSTNVTLNKPTGQITLNNSPLAAGASVFFYLHNTLVNNTDIVIAKGAFIGTVNPQNYQIDTLITQAGDVLINVKNIYVAPLSEALVINFVIIKGANS